MNIATNTTTTGGTPATARHKTRLAALYEEPSGNRVYIENGEVKTDVFTDTMSIEEAARLLHKMVDMEYSLPQVHLFLSIDAQKYR